MFNPAKKLKDWVRAQIKEEVEYEVKDLHKSLEQVQADRALLHSLLQQAEQKLGATVSANSVEQLATDNHQHLLELEQKFACHESNIMSLKKRTESLQQSIEKVVETSRTEEFW